MSTRTLLVSAGLLIFCGGAHAQPRPLPSALPPDAAPRVPSEKSVDELIADLERLRAQKAALEKQERDLTATLQKRLQTQAERLQKLGVGPKDANPGEPDRVGRIIIEGNTKTPDRKILDKLALTPGQVLQYPKLENARTNLEKAGFRGVTVEVIPNELDPVFKDIRVRIDESKR